MAFTPISNTVPQYEENGVAASGYFIKFYESGTTTPTAMATDSTGTTLLDKCELNTEGYPINGSSAVFIPHINKKYKIALFRNAADADANDLASAAWPAVDGLFPAVTSETTYIEGIDSVSDIEGLIAEIDNQQISLKGWLPDSDVGGGILYWDAAKPKSEHNGGTIFSPTVPYSAITSDYINGAGETDSAGSGCWVMTTTRAEAELSVNVSANAGQIVAESARIDSNEARLTAAELVNTNQDSEISALQAAQGAGVIGYALQSELFADLAHDENTVGYVTNDPDSNKNGVYRKVGASGAGSWAQSSGTIPANSVTRSELTKDFSYNGQLSASTDLNAVRDNGTYHGASGNGFVNMPSGFTGAFVLNVEEAYDGAGNFLIQVMRDFNNQLITWVRRLSGGGSANDWQRVYQNEYMLTKGHLPNNSSTQDANEDGIYFLASANTYTDMPAGAPTADYVLSVNEAFFTSKGRFKNQRISASTTPNLAWVRRVDLLGAATQSWQKATASPDSVGRDQLTANFADKNIISSVDANDIQDDGTYLITDPTSVSNLPVGASTGILEVRGANGNNFGFQEYTDLFNADLKQRRMTRPGNSTVSPWKGMAASEKVIACFGDSITENGTYPQQLAQMIGGQVLRMGFGGCRMANHESAGYNTMSMNNMSANIASGDYTTLINGAQLVFDETGDDNRVQAALVASTDWNAVDYVIMFWGTNDFAANVPLGTTAGTDGTTFLGAINKTISNLLGAYPHLKILLITPFWRPRILAGDGKESDTNPNTNGDYLIDFADAIIERSNNYHLDYMDFYRTGGINPLTQYAYLGAGDDIHPKNPEGYTHVAERIAAAFKSKF